MEERTGSAGEPNNVPAGASWEETKRLAQNSFIGTSKNALAKSEHFRRNVEFWVHQLSSEIALDQDHPEGDRTMHEREIQPDLGEPER